jgi:hypothetical protein
MSRTLGCTTKKPPLMRPLPVSGFSAKETMRPQASSPGAKATMTTVIPAARFGAVELDGERYLAIGL